MRLFLLGGIYTLCRMQLSRVHAQHSPHPDQSELAARLVPVFCHFHCNHRPVRVGVLPSV